MIFPFLDVELHTYDLGIENRDATDDQGELRTVLGRMVKMPRDKVHYGDQRAVRESDLDRVVPFLIHRE